MRRILVIQLLRIGDVLQTTPALAGLKEENPGSYIAVLVRSVFAEPLLHNQAVDEVITWDVDSLLIELFDRKVPLAENYRRVETLIDELRRRGFDTVINLTNDFISALITYLLNAREVVGLSYRPDGSLKINGNWIKYLFIVPDNRKYNRYNLVDILANACGVKETRRALSFPTAQEDGEFARNFLREAGLSKDKLIIGFQPGASKAFKRWPAERFAELGDKLIKEHNAQIILFGSADEIDLGDEIQARMNEPATNAIGKTTLGRLAALLKNCDMLITNDTGTMHVAVAVGTRTLVLSFGSVCTYQTGPYGNGHFVLEPDIDCFPCSSPGLCNSLACRDLLTVDSVLRAFELAQLFQFATEVRPNAMDANVSADRHARDGELGYSGCQVDELDGLILYCSFLDPRLKRLTFVPVNRPCEISGAYMRADEILKEIYAQFWEGMCNDDMIYPVARRGSPDLVTWAPRTADLIFPVDDVMNCCLRDDAERSQVLDGLKGYIREFKNVESLAETGINLLRQILSVGEIARDNVHRIKPIAAMLEQVEKSLEEAGDAVKFLTSHFLRETRFIRTLPPMAVATIHLKSLQNLKFHTEFLVSVLAFIESQISRQNIKGQTGGRDPRESQAT